jgi:hypothetical protein
MTSRYTTAELVQAELRLTTEFSPDTLPTDTSIDAWITQASRQVELMTNTIFTRTTTSSELYDWSATTTILNLPVSDLISVTKVEYNISGAGVTPSWVTLTEGQDADYIVYTAYNEIEFTRGTNAVVKGYPGYGKQKLRLTYIHGFSTTPLEVQYLTTLIVAKRVVQTLMAYQANTKMGEVTVGPVRVADPSQFSINYMRFINDEIDRVANSLALTYKTFKFSTRSYDGVSGYGNY